MPSIQVGPTLVTYYEDDYFGEPWVTPETVLLIHGVAESSDAWRTWVPHLARRYRVLRPDNRGFGRSTIPPRDYPWSTENFAADLAHFLDRLGVDRAHVVGAKIGGAIALQFAASYPERTRTLAVVSGPVRGADRGSRGIGSFPDFVREKGVRAWAEATQRARLGSDASPEQIAYWNYYMGRADRDVLIGVTSAAGRLDLYDLLPRIQAPTLVFTTEGGTLQSVEAVRAWQARIPNSELIVLPGDSYHPAATQPDRCAQAVLAHLRRG